MTDLQKLSLTLDLLEGLRQSPPDLQREWYDNCMLMLPQDEELLTLIYKMAASGKVS